MIKDTWFYQTNLKHYPELQEIILSEQQPNLELKSQIISGSVGVGKTHNTILLAKKYITETYEDGWHYSYEPIFIQFDEYLTMLSNYQFGNPEMKSEAYYKLQQLENSQFVIIDDLHINLLSDYHKKVANNHLLGLFNKYYARRKEMTLIITTNNNKEELSETYGESVMSRLLGICEYLEVNGEDKRLL